MDFLFVYSSYKLTILHYYYLVNAYYKKYIPATNKLDGKSNAFLQSTHTI